ncbi:MAG TPA: hypothetical protein VLG49_02475 [Rhabdochlamydiaceae bacterium]|nr:hypothetical protein [Rhabdochlamydiaceae bacterium]
MSVNNYLPNKKHIFPLAGIGINSALHTAFNGNIPESIKLANQSILQTDDISFVANRVLDNQPDQHPILKRKFPYEETDFLNVAQQETSITKEGGEEIEVRQNFLENQFDEQTVNNLDFSNLKDQDVRTEQFWINLFQDKDTNPTGSSAPSEYPSGVNRTTETISLENAPDLNWNMLSDSEKLDLPRMALEKVQVNRGISKQQIIKYFPENNKVEIQDNRYVFVYNNSYNFPNYYNPPSPYHWNNGSRRSTNIYIIGIILKRIMQSSNLKDEELEQLIKDMMKRLRNKMIKPNQALQRLTKIQNRLRSNAQTQDRTMNNSHDTLFINNPILIQIQNKQK